ncbi:MAG: hypothetical protein DMF95_14145 [Acidobacteria bacterium]|nr:MAG: hypothetical protein DMF95_14145 [Acidobacteriota bacterium]
MNCPIVPNDSTVDPGSSKPEEAFFEGQIVTIVPYDIEDGGFNVQTMFKFEEVARGVHYTIGRTNAGARATSTVDNANFIPHLVASHALGDPFYTSVWDVWTVTVPVGTDVSLLKSKDAIKAAAPANGWPIAASGIRLNCPVIKVDGVPVPIEDAFALLTDDTGRFDRNKFPFDVPTRTFTKMRNFFITEINPGAGAAVPHAAPPPPTLTGLAAEFPPVEPEGKGNVIPVILTDPLHPTHSSGPNSSGDVIRLDQAALDAAFAHNRLPEAFEHNIAFLAEGLAAFVGQPGLRTYGDFKRHDMGAGLFAPGAASTQTTMKTAELWDVGSDSPLSRTGSFGSDMRGVILAHGNEGEASKQAFLNLTSGGQQDIVNFLRMQTIQGKVGEGSGAIILQTHRLSGAARNIPLDGGFKASFSVDASGKPTWGTGSLSYSYDRTG